jgi:uncharacterized protein (TIGR03067 family)
MKPLAATFAALVLLAGAVAADEPEKKQPQTKEKEPEKKGPGAAEELQRFQGTWQLEGWEEGGKPLAADDLKKRGVFFGANLFLFRRDGKLHRAGTIQLDPSKSPATANLSVREGEGKDDVMLGIYSLEGDTLRLCFDPKGQNRPASFKPDAKSGFTLITLKKPKPAVEERVDIVGKYRSELVEANTGKVTITQVAVEKRGDAYTLTYRLDKKVLFIGTALRRGDVLSMSWVSSNQIGVSVYKIEPGPKLTGDYTILGGIGVTAKETLKPWQRVD